MCLPFSLCLSSGNTIMVNTVNLYLAIWMEHLWTINIYSGVSVEHTSLITCSWQLRTRCLICVWSNSIGAVFYTLYLYSRYSDMQWNDYYLLVGVHCSRTGVYYFFRTLQFALSSLHILAVCKLLNLRYCWTVKLFSSQFVELDAQVSTSTVLIDRYL